MTRYTNPTATNTSMQRVRLNNIIIHHQNIVPIAGPNTLTHNTRNMHRQGSVPQWLTLCWKASLWTFLNYMIKQTTSGRTLYYEWMDLEIRGWVLLKKRRCTWICSWNRIPLQSRFAQDSHAPDGVLKALVWNRAYHAYQHGSWNWQPPVAANTWNQRCLLFIQSVDQERRVCLDAAIAFLLIITDTRMPKYEGGNIPDIIAVLNGTIDDGHHNSPYTRDGRSHHRLLTQATIPTSPQHVRLKPC